MGQVWSALLPFISSYRCFALLPILSIECWHCWAWFGLSEEEASVWIKTSPRVEPPRFQSTSDFWSFSIKFFRPFRDFGFIFWRNISLPAQSYRFGSNRQVGQIFFHWSISAFIKCCLRSWWSCQGHWWRPVTTAEWPEVTISPLCSFRCFRAPRRRPRPGAFFINSSFDLTVGRSCPSPLTLYILWALHQTLLSLLSKLAKHTKKLEGSWPTHVWVVLGLGFIDNDA